MEKPTLQSLQEKAARLASELEDGARRLREILEELPVDLEDGSAEMVDWTVCPSVTFQVHGLLSFGLRDLEEAMKPIQAGSRVTAESVYEDWREVVDRRLYREFERLL